VTDASERRLAVRGMTCGACQRRVQRALGEVSGIERVRVDLDAGAASVVCRRGVPVDALARAVAAAGYLLEEGAPEPADVRPSWRPLAVGIGAAGGLLLVYLGVIAVAQGWAHAARQLADDRWFVLPLAGGFGAQAGLLTRLRAAHAHASAGGMATSAGTSGAAMLACCAHHLAHVVPLLGVAGATALLAEYKLPLLWLGLAMNAAGVAYLVWRLRRGRAVPEPVGVAA
jgi:copper chaperone CopZ